MRGGVFSRAEASAKHFGEKEDSSAQINIERELEFAQDAHVSAAINQAQSALNRISADTYGVCIDCGTNIPAARLHATPEAERCIACLQATV